MHLEYEELNQAEEVFARLSDGGSVTMPIGQTFWAWRFGMVTDRFGVPWMISAGTGKCEPEAES